MVTPSSPATMTIGSGPDTLSLAVAEDAYQGDAQFTISVDGAQQGGVQTATASNAAGQIQTFNVLGSFGTSGHTVSVNFLNDAYDGTVSADRNLYVKSASIDGQAIAGSSLDETSAGPQSFSFSITPAAPAPVAAPTPAAAVAIGSGPDTLSLAVAEDAYAGDAQFTISVDGAQQGGVQTATASNAAGQIQTFNVLGSFGTSGHTVSVNFLNDAYDGTVSADRNLYVKSASIDGQAIAGSSLDETSAGPQSFSFGTAATVTPVPVLMPPSSAINVSTSGSDVTGDGSAAHPFATLQHAIELAEQSSTKTIDVADGTYRIASTLTLTTADNGITISGTSGATLDGTGAGTILSLQQANNVSLSGMTFDNPSASAVVVDGGAQNTISGVTFVGNVEDVLLQNGATANTVSGNTMSSTATSAIEVKDGSDGNTFSNNTINGVGASETSGGGFYLHGADNNLITHNLIENTQGAGIDSADFYTTGTGTENIGNTISYNDLENTDLSSTDSGAIYILGRSQADTMTTVSMNFINGAGRASEHSVGIYLDDNTNGVTASNNIVTGSMSDAFQIHGGNNDHFVNNLFDLGTGAASAGLFQPSPDDQYSATQFQNDFVTRNVYVSESSSPNNPLFVNLGMGKPTISGNDYWSTNGAPLNTAPDTSPAYVNPNVSAGNYTTSGDGIGFTAIDRSMIGLLHS